IFPLTRINKNMYLPLPVLGSLYPLVRTTIFYSAEDTTHPLYRELINDVTRTTKDFSNLIFVAGHDHGLQMIQDNNFIQIVTGSGAKRSHIRSEERRVGKAARRRRATGPSRNMT